MSGGIRDAESPRGGARDRLPPRQPRHGGARGARSGPRAPSPSTATGSRSAWTCAGTTLAARGWTQEGGDLWETLARLDGEGCARYVVTDVNKDGMLAGPNLDLLREVCARTDRPVVASGGVSTLEDIRVLRTLVDDGVEGAIIGSALYRDAFTLPEALDVAGRP